MPIVITGSTVNWTRDCRPRWLLNELGIPYEHVQLQLFSGEGKTPAHLAKHPLGKVPVVEDDDVVLWESGAAVLHLAEKYGEGKLLPPRNSVARARCYQWMFFAVTSLEQASTKLYAARRFSKGKPGAAEREEEARKELATLRKALDPAVEPGPFVVGETFTAADVLVGSTLHWLHKVGGLDDAPPLAAYYARISQRPAFKKTYSEGED